MEKQFDATEKQKNMTETTLDYLYDGRLALKQPRNGYRFSVDAPLLTWFIKAEKTARTCIDLGAGCGVVGLGLLATGSAEKVLAVELQPVFAALALENAVTNSLECSIEILNADMRKLGDRLPSESFELVAINPPFWRANAGRLSKDETKRIACHEIAITLNEWVNLSKQLLHPRRGRLCAVFPAKRTDELLLALAKCGMTATRILFVHPKIFEPAEIVLVEARLGQTGRMMIVSPLILKTEDGADTEMAREILSGNYSNSLRSLKDRRVSG